MQLTYDTNYYGQVFNIYESSPIYTKPESRPIVMFCDSIYQFDPHNAKYEAISKEGLWGASRYSCYVNGIFYVVSVATGKIFGWNPKDQTYTTLSNDDWKYCLGMVSIGGYLFIVCDNIWRMDPRDGTFVKASKENGWGWVKANTVCAHKGEIYMVNGTTGKILSWNPIDASVKTVSNENWNSTGAIVDFQGRLFVFAASVYELDTKDGSYEKRSKGIGWNVVNSITVHENKIYVVLIRKVVINNVTTVYGDLWSFDPVDGESRHLDYQNWINCHTMY